MAQPWAPLIPSRNEIIVNRRMHNAYLQDAEHYSCAVCRYQAFLTGFRSLGRMQDIMADPSDLAPEYASLDGSSIVLARDLSTHTMLYFDEEISQYKRVNRQPVTSPHPALYSAETATKSPVFPVCSNCFFLLRPFMEYRKLHRPRSPSVRPIRNLEDVYELLCDQFLLDQNRQFEQRKFRLGWKHEAFTTGAVLNPTYIQSNMEHWWVVANPGQPIPSLPSYFLSRLELVPQAVEDGSDRQRDVRPLGNSPAGIVQQSPLLRLPTELVTEVASYLDFESVFAFRQTCVQAARSISLNQHFWFKQLTNGDLFGFFIFFDAVNVAKEIRNKAIRCHKTPPRWDWKRLIGQIGRYSSFENGGVFHDAHPGFRNRRRIWKILETMEMEYVKPKK